MPTRSQRRTRSATDVAPIFSMARAVQLHRALGGAVRVPEGAAYAFSNQPQHKYRVASKARLAPGKPTITFDLEYDGPGYGKSGTGTLSVDGIQAAQGRIERTIPVRFSLDETFDVGEAPGASLRTFRPFALPPSGIAEPVLTGRRESRARRIIGPAHPRKRFALLLHDGFWRALQWRISA